MRSHKDILESVRALRAGAVKAAGDMAQEVTDPSLQGQVTPPTDPNGEAPKTGLPAGNDNPKEKQPTADPTDTGEVTEKNVPAAKEEPKTDPNPSMDKVSAAVKRAQELRNKACAPRTAATDNQPADKQAGEELTFSPEFMLKLSSVILSCQDGVEFARDILARQAGAEIAQQTIKAARDEFVEMQKLAAEEQEVAEYIGYLDGLQKEAAAVYNDADEGTQRQIEALAAFRQKMAEAGMTEEEMAALDAGMGDAAIAADMEEEGEPLPAEGEAAGEEVTTDEILEVLEELVDEGAIPEEEAVQIAEALIAEDMPAEEIPPEAEVSEEDLAAAEELAQQM